MMLFKRRRTRRRAMSGAAVGVVVATALVAQMSIVSNASWTDEEWVSTDSVGTVSCTDPEGAFATRGEGRALSGSLLGIDLDTLAEASGVEVTNKNGQVTVDPSSALPAPSDPAYANPLNVTALSAVDVNLGNGLLQLPLDNSTGVLGQFGEAQSTGVARGASGFITNTGGIGLEPQNGYPELASLNLKQLLATINPAAAALGDIANLSLSMGAVTGRANLDGCDMVWDGAQDALSRDYLATSVSTEINSPTVGALGTTVLGVINGLQPAINSLVGNQGLLNSITGPLVTALTNVLAGPNGSGLLRIDGTEVVITATVDTSQLMALLDSPLKDGAGVVSIDVTQGTIQVDLVALLGAAYPTQYSDGLNGLPPNTDLLSDQHVLDTLSTVVASVLNSWVGQIQSVLAATIDAVQLNVQLKVKLSVFVTVVVTSAWIEIGSIDAQVSGTLTQLLQNQGIVDANLVLLSGLSAIPILGGALVTLLNGLLKPVTDLLLLTVKTTLGGIVGNALIGVFDVLKILPATVQTAATAITSLVSNLYNALFLNGVVQILVNAQNDTVLGGAEPADWAGLPSGQYDVAALRIGVLGAFQENDVRLYLGRGSVGPVCAPVSVMAGGCAGY